MVTHCSLCSACSLFSILFAHRPVNQCFQCSGWLTGLSGGKEIHSSDHSPLLHQLLRWCVWRSPTRGNLPALDAHITTLSSVWISVVRQRFNISVSCGVVAGLGERLQGSVCAAVWCQAAAECRLEVLHVRTYVCNFSAIFTQVSRSSAFSIMPTKFLHLFGTQIRRDA